MGRAGAWRASVFKGSLSPDVGQPESSEEVWADGIKMCVQEAVP